MTELNETIRKSLGLFTYVNPSEEITNDTLHRILLSVGSEEDCEKVPRYRLKEETNILCRAFKYKTYRDHLCEIKFVISHFIDLYGDIATEAGQQMFLAMYTVYISHLIEEEQKRFEIEFDKNHPDYKENNES